MKNPFNIVNDIVPRTGMLIVSDKFTASSRRFFMKPEFGNCRDNMGGTIIANPEIYSDFRIFFGLS